ncbi:MAG TPA: tripartite tricarboxylate transporter substrate binding protein, partial [Burkholderiales bacterium]|nr:tripartite tricarboxylate transporter substrate binding protein [Burkholderiales bacterium]
PGGGADLVARSIAHRITENSGIQFVLDNRPGAGTIVAAELAARSAPDGYTIFHGANTSHAINPNLHAKLPYDPIKDFAPVTKLASFPNILVVHPSLPVRTLKDFVVLARARPGELNFASSGTGTPAQLAGVMFGDAAHIKIVHVPYKGSGPALTALLSGETQLMFGSLASTLPYVRNNRLRPIAVTSARRSAAIPEMPTIAESGYTGFEAITWHALFVPAGTSPAVINRLHAEFSKALDAKDFKASMIKQGADAASSTPDELAAYVKSELALYAKLVKQAGMHAD